MRNLRSRDINDMQAIVRDGRITQYRITARRSFVLDDEDHGERRRR